MELYKVILGYEGVYEVSNYGNVKSLNSHIPKVMKHKVNEQGYKKISLSKLTIRRYYFIHRLVAIAFIPNPENKPMVNHKNGIKDDNRLENLEWATAKENVMHAHKNNLVKTVKGAKHHAAKLVEKQVLDIRKSNLKYSELSKIYGISIQQISNIANRATWKHI